jgi:malate/lactate dehydrogenase
MTYLASEVSGFPRSRVMGMAGVLDSARLGRRGVEEIVTLDLEPAELDQLRAAAAAIKARCEDLASLGG